MQDVGTWRGLTRGAVRAAGKCDELVARAPDGRFAVALVDDELPALDEQLRKGAATARAVIEGEVQPVHELLNFDIVHRGQRGSLARGVVRRDRYGQAADGCEDPVPVRLHYSLLQGRAFIFDTSYRVRGIGARSVGLGRTPFPCDVAPATESQCFPGAGGVSCGHLKRPLSPRPPPGNPLRSGCKPTLMIVPRGN